LSAFRERGCWVRGTGPQIDRRREAARNEKARPFLEVWLSSAGVILVAAAVSGCAVSQQATSSLSQIAASSSLQPSASPPPSVTATASSLPTATPSPTLSGYSSSTPLAIPTPTWAAVSIAVPTCCQVAVPVGWVLGGPTDNGTYLFQPSNEPTVSFQNVGPATSCPSEPSAGTSTMAINGQLVTLTFGFGGDVVSAEVVVGSSCIDVSGAGVLDSPDLILVEQILSSIEPPT